MDKLNKEYIEILKKTGVRHSKRGADGRIVF